MALHSHLGGQLVFLLQVGLTNRPGLINSNGERLLHVDVEITVQGPVGNIGMGMIGGAAEDGIQVRMVKALAPIFVDLGLGKFFLGMSDGLLVHITERHHILIFEGAVVSSATAVGPDERDIQFIIRRILSK
jgi:hypothetical protein